MCHGACPDEVSFATHCRVSSGLHESLARVEDGGQAFVDALADALAQNGVAGGQVDIRTNTGLAACTDIVARQARRFVLSDGSEVTAGTCIFTIHPRSILATLPADCTSRAFAQRVNDFESSIGFFALFGTLDSPPESDLAPITSILPNLDLNAMLRCRTPEPVDGPLVVLRNNEQTRRGTVQTVSVMEVDFPQWSAAWEDSRAGEWRRSRSVNPRVAQTIGVVARTTRPSSSMSRNATWVRRIAG